MPVIGYKQPAGYRAVMNLKATVEQGNQSCRSLRPYSAKLLYDIELRWNKKLPHQALER